MIKQEIKRDINNNTHMSDAFFITGDKAARYRVAYTTTSSSFLMSMSLKWFLKKSSQLILKDENNIMLESGYI